MFGPTALAPSPAFPKIEPTPGGPAHVPMPSLAPAVAPADLPAPPFQPPSPGGLAFQPPVLEAPALPLPPVLPAAPAPVGGQETRASFGEPDRQPEPRPGAAMEESAGAGAIESTGQTAPPQAPDPQDPQAQPDELKPDDAQPGDPKPDEPKPGEPEAGEPEAARTSGAVTLTLAGAAPARPEDHAPAPLHEALWGPARFAGPPLRPAPEAPHPGPQVSAPKAKKAPVEADQPWRRPAGQRTRTSRIPPSEVPLRAEPEPAAAPAGVVVTAPPDTSWTPPGSTEDAPKPARPSPVVRLLGRSPVLVIVGVAVLALVAVLAYPRPAPKHTKVKGTRTALPASHAVVSDLAGYTLVSVGPTGAVTLAPFGGVAPRRTVPDFTASVYPQQPIETGQSVALVANGQAYRVGSPPSAPPAALGSADTLFPSEIDGTVGAYSPGSGSAPGTVRTLVVTGTAGDSPAVPFPPGYTPAALLSDGFYLVLSNTNSLQLWDSARGPSPAAMVATYGRASTVIGVSGTHFAWLDAANCDTHGECPLHITDAATGQGGLVPAPPGYAGYLGVGAFDPANGNMVAALVYDPINNAPGARLVLLTRTANAWVPALVPQSSLIPGPPAIGHVAWTPDGGHVLFSGAFGPIHDYRLGDPAPFETEQPASDAFTVIGKPLPSQ